jgi:hypothetical protein
MTKARATIAVLLSSVVLTVVALFVLPVSAQRRAERSGAERTLTPRQLQAIKHKAAAFKASGIRYRSDETASVQGPADAPARRFTHVERTTKKELLARWQATYDAAAKEYNLPRVSAAQGKVPENVRPIDGWDAAAELEYIRSLPDGPVEIPIEGVERGEHSIDYTMYTYNSSSKRVDPINLLFFGPYGRSHDVRYSMENTDFTDERPWVEDCGSKQWVFIWDEKHGGRDDWKSQNYDMADRNIRCIALNPGARYHMRLFGSFVPDSHGGFGHWAVGAAHYDPKGHDCSRYLDTAQRLVVQHFVDNNYDPLWFVGKYFTYYLGNTGKTTGQCSGETHDGYESDIKIIH